MEFINKNPKIFILSGKAKSGKNYVADKIEEYYINKKCIQLSYAYYLKQYIKKIINWNETEEAKPRDLLQSLGIDLIKNEIDKELLIRRTMEDIQVYSYFYDIIIITDARLIEEIEIPRKLFQQVTVIRVNRLNNQNHLTAKQKMHITETALDNYAQYDYLLESDSLEMLKIKIEEMLKNMEVEENR